MYEGDTLFSTVTVERTRPLPDGGGLVRLRSLVNAVVVEVEEPREVLDWRYVAVMA